MKHGVSETKQTKASCLLIKSKLIQITKFPINKSFMLTEIFLPVILSL